MVYKVTKADAVLFQGDMPSCWQFLLNNFGSLTVVQLMVDKISITKNKLED